MENNGRNNSQEPPPLPPSLTDLYCNLDSRSKGLFNKVFKWLWVYLNGRKVNLIFFYWCVDRARRKHKLTCTELSLLSWLYQSSFQGSRCVNSAYLYNGGAFPYLLRDAITTTLNDLKHKGYISRSTSDPSLPFLSRSYSRQPVFISLTGVGVRLIQTIDQELYKTMLHSSFNDITGTNKKG